MQRCTGVDTAVMCGANGSCLLVCQYVPIVAAELQDMGDCLDCVIMVV